MVYRVMLIWGYSGCIGVCTVRFKDKLKSDGTKLNMEHDIETGITCWSHRLGLVVQGCGLTLNPKP